MRKYLSKELGRCTVMTLYPVFKTEGCKRQGECQGLDKQARPQLASLDNEILRGYSLHLEQNNM